MRCVWSRRQGESTVTRQMLEDGTRKIAFGKEFNNIQKNRTVMENASFVAVRLSMKKIVLNDRNGYNPEKCV